MTRPADQIERALSLRPRGHTPTTVARELGIPRSTVQDWLCGRVPGARAPGINDCTNCGNALHDFAILGPLYAYLLGLYLGDGCLSAHQRAVYKLRIVLDASYPGIIGKRLWQ